MWSIYKRKIKWPVVSTWCLWLVIGALFFITSRKAGADWNTTLFPILIGVINPAIIVCLSLRYGQYKWTKLDTACVIVCITTVIVWQTTQSPVLGILGGVLADVIAATPQVIKSWKNPKDEPLFPWSMFTIGSAVNILAVKEWEIGHWIFPIYMTGMGMLLTLPLLLYRLRSKETQKAWEEIDRSSKDGGYW